MKKVLFSIVILLLVSAAVFLCVKPHQKNDDPARSVASVEEKCRLYSKSEAEAIQQACPIVQESDFDTLAKECLNSKPTTEPDCEFSNSAVEIELSQLRAEILVKDLNFEKKLRLHDQINNVLTKLETINRNRQCDINPQLHSLLPLLSIVDPKMALISVASGSIASRFLSLVKSKGLKMGAKLELCAANTLARESRSLVCRQIVYTQPSYLEPLKKDLDKLEAELDRAKTSKAFQFMEHINAARSALEKLKSAKNENLASVHRQIESALLGADNELGCSDKNQGFKICADLNHVYELASKNLMNWNIPTSEKADALSKVENFLSQDFLLDFISDSMVTETTPDGAISRFISLDKGRSEILGDSTRTISDVRLIQNGGLETINDYRRRFATNQLSSEPAARSMSSGLDKLPKDLNIPDKQKAVYCQALSCFWAKGQNQDQAIGDKLKLSSNLQEHGYDPISPMDMNAYSKVGKSLTSWDVKLKHYNKSLTKIIDTCASSNSICELDCMESQEKSYLKNGSLFQDSGEASGSNR